MQTVSPADAGVFVCMKPDRGARQLLEAVPVLVTGRRARRAEMHDMQEFSGECASVATARLCTSTSDICIQQALTSVAGRCAVRTRLRSGWQALASKNKCAGTH